MNLPIDVGTVPAPHFLPIKFPDFDVSWAGPHPFRPGFCLGSEDGRLLFTDENGQLLSVGSMNFREAINGVASGQNWVAISTRANVSFYKKAATADEKNTLAVFPGGAHGVIATQNGHFVAPLGRNGLMSVMPDSSRELSINIRSSVAEESVNVYQVISLARDNKELLACAMRTGGVGVTDLDSNVLSRGMNTIAFDGLDVVDICAIDPSGASLAAAAIGKNGTLVLFRDVANDKRPLTIKYEHIEGTAYRLLCARGHLFLLTGQGMHFFAHLAERFLTGLPIGGIDTPVLCVPMDAVDANLYLDQWLLVVMLDEVRRYDIGQLHDSIPKRESQNNSQHPAPRQMEPDWKERGIAQLSTAAFAGVA